MPDRSRKRPRDPNQLGKLIVDIATGEAEDAPPQSEKNQAAVELGRKGGLKGGKARAAAMTADERSQAARRAAKARWERKNQA
ncbi:MAG: histone H1 [Solirubrobacterales bacterium]